MYFHFCFSFFTIVFTIGLNICEIIARIKTHKSEIKEKKKKLDDIAFLAKTNLDCIT